MLVRDNPLSSGIGAVDSTRRERKDISERRNVIGDGQEAAMIMTCVRTQ